MTFYEFRSPLFEETIPSLCHVVLGKPCIAPPGDNTPGMEMQDARDPSAARGGFPPSWREIPIARVSQVHGTALSILPSRSNLGLRDAREAAGTEIVADGLVSEQPGTLLRIVIADCMPVFLVDAKRKRTALVHAGWRGLAAGILERATQRLSEGGSSPSNLSAWIGPHIGADSYEVGPEVIAAFPGVPPAFRHGRGDRAFLDLYATARAILRAAGVAASSIEERPPCTFRDERLFSYRAGDRNRNVAFLGFAE